MRPIFLAKSTCVKSVISVVRVPGTGRSRLSRRDTSPKCRRKSLQGAFPRLSRFSRTRGTQVVLTHFFARFFDSFLAKNIAVSPCGEAFHAFHAFHANEVFRASFGGPLPRLSRFSRRYFCPMRLPLWQSFTLSRSPSHRDNHKGDIMIFAQLCQLEPRLEELLRE